MKILVVIFLRYWRPPVRRCMYLYNAQKITNPRVVSTLFHPQQNIWPQVYLPTVLNVLPLRQIWTHNEKIPCRGRQRLRSVSGRCSSPACQKHLLLSICKERWRKRINKHPYSHSHAAPPQPVRVHAPSHVSAQKVGINSIASRSRCEPKTKTYSSLLSRASASYELICVTVLQLSQQSASDRIFQFRFP